MPQVIIEQPGVTPMTVPLSGEQIRFGRAEDNDVVLVADEVSRHHAVLYRRAGKMVLQDKNSLNGTYVNRKRIERHQLFDGDEMQIGKFKLAFMQRKAGE